MIDPIEGVVIVMQAKATMKQASNQAHTHKHFWLSRSGKWHGLLFFVSSAFPIPNQASEQASKRKREEEEDEDKQWRWQGKRKGQREGWEWTRKRSKQGRECKRHRQEGGWWIVVGVVVVVWFQCRGIITCAWHFDRECGWGCLDACWVRCPLAVKVQVGNKRQIKSKPHCIPRANSICRIRGWVRLCFSFSSGRSQG